MAKEELDVNFDLQHTYKDYWVLCNQIEISYTWLSSSVRDQDVTERYLTVVERNYPVEGHRLLTTTESIGGPAFILWYDTWYNNNIRQGFVRNSSILVQSCSWRKLRGFNSCNGYGLFVEGKVTGDCYWERSSFIGLSYVTSEGESNGVVSNMRTWLENCLVTNPFNWLYYL